MSEKWTWIGIGTLGTALGTTVFAAWLTHVVHTILAEEWIFLLAGAIFAPLGVVHGVGIWFGVW